MNAARVYGWTLRAFPARHRAAYAAEMVETFQHELDSRRTAGGRWTALWFTVAACVNAVVAGLGERRRQRRDGFTPTIGFSTLDFVLAWRILLRYPGLSIVGVFGMAVGIAISAGAFTIVSAMMTAELPLPEGERVVSLMNWDVSSSNRELRLMHDLPSWRGMRSVEDMGTSRNAARTLISPSAAPETISVAEISASAFRLARVPALRGRHLVPEDERAGAPDVIVIGHDQWLRRFDADPDIVGRSLQLGNTTYAIVGVMPEGFLFPVDHQYWIPWRLDPTGYEPRSGPVVHVFGRLVPGATLDTAQAELSAITMRTTTDLAATHQHLRARVMPYTYAYNDMADPVNALALRFIQLAIVLLLIVVCVNVAILVYARTAARQGEIAVRAALGASRRRIVAQLFAEALMLAAVAAALGLGLLSVALRQLEGALLVWGGALPFWMTITLSANDLAYIVGLTLLSAAIVGVAPALKATGRQVHSGLQGLSPGSGSKMQMGWLWTALIVAQVALTVALLPVAIFYAWVSLQPLSGGAGFASHQFISAQVLPDRTVAPPTPAGEAAFRSRNRLLLAELERRLEAEPAVSQVTFSMAGPGEERALILEVEGQPVPAEHVNYNIVEGSKSGFLVRFNRVSPDYFEAYDVPMLMGRGLRSTDAVEGGPATGVLVNRTLVDSLFGGASPLGHRIRYVGRSREADARDVELDRWYEVVGVVSDFPKTSFEHVSRVYHAAIPGDVYPAAVAVRVSSGDPSTFAGTLRAVTAAIDPNLQLHDILTRRQAAEREQGMMRLVGVTVVIVMLSVVVLSAAGIYALMSFTVARRRREIGIRTALGANRNRILMGIFSRALGQLAAGAVVGMFGAIGLERLLEGEMFEGQAAVILPIVAVFMTVVGLLAALGPARRGLSIQPTEALREE